MTTLKVLCYPPSSPEAPFSQWTPWNHPRITTPFLADFPVTIMASMKHHVEPTKPSIHSKTDHENLPLSQGSKNSLPQPTAPAQGNSTQDTHYPKTAAAHEMPPQPPGSPYWDLLPRSPRCRIHPLPSHDSATRFPQEPVRLRKTTSSKMFPKEALNPKWPSKPPWTFLLLPQPNPSLVPPDLCGTLGDLNYSRRPPTLKSPPTVTLRQRT